jgi:DNA polymerase III alpha subunit
MVHHVDSMRTRRPVRAFVLVVLLLSVAAGEAANETIKNILADPTRHDGQAVTLDGTIAYLDARVSKKGNPYYTFKLDDGSGRLTVFSFGEPPCPARSRVTVDGQFRRVKQQSGHTFRDQIDARRVTCR